MPHFQGWVSLPYKQRTDWSDILLRFSDGEFTRNSIAGEWIDSINSFKRFDSGAPVIVRRNGKRYLQCCGQYQNMLLRSEELSNGTWAKTAASAVANTATAPDGSATADVMTLDNNVAARVAQDINVVYDEDDMVYDFTFFYRRNGGSDVQFRANIEKHDATLETQTLTATADWQLAHLSADSEAGGTQLAVSFTQLATPAMARVIDIWGCQVTRRDNAETPGPVPYVRSSASAGQHNGRDALVFDAADVPGQIFRAAFKLHFKPMFASTAFAASSDYHYLLAILVNEGEDDQRTAGLRLTGSGGACLVQWLGDAGTVVASRTITFSAEQELTFTLDAQAGTLTVGGATTGDGTATAAAPWNITTSAVMLGGGNHLTAGGAVAIAGWTNDHTLSAGNWATPGMAFSADGLTGLTAGGSGLVARSTAPATWSESDISATLTGGDGNLTDVAFGAGGSAVVVGANGTGYPAIAYTANGGSSWLTPTTDLSSIAAVNSGVWHVVCFVSGTTFVAVVDDGAGNLTPLKSTDGGDNWTAYTAIGSAASISDLIYDATSGRVILVANGGVYISTDGGETYGSLIAVPGTGVVAATCVVRFDGDLWAGGYDSGGSPTRAIWKSTDNGDSWTLQTITGLTGMLSVNRLLVVGAALAAGCSAPTGASSAVSHSVDGLAWTDVADSISLTDAGFATSVNCLAYGNDRLQGVSSKEFIFSADLTGGSGTATPTSALGYVSEPRVAA